jgi:proline iminopeptidase
MAERYPEIEPYEHEMLDVGDDQRLYWEVCGNRNGKPALVLHGGPGSGCTPGLRRYFDPGAYRLVLFDQRGSGRSVPHASDPSVDLSSNTTHNLIRDIELLREVVGVERWLVWGISWGATLALAYAESHPQRVTEIVLGSVTMTRPADIHWLYHGVGRFLPEEWACFRDGVPEPERDGDLVAAYYRLLNDPLQVVREKAARDCVTGKMRSSRSSPVTSATHGTTTRGSGWHSRGSLLTTSITMHGSRMASCCATRTDWPGSRVPWSTVALISAALRSPRGSLRKRGRTPSFGWWRRVTPVATT